MKKSEIILFETKDKEVTLSVPMDGDTVWLTQAQMAELFNTTKQNVSLHANNCFKEGELDMKSVVKDFLTTASDGKNYKTKYYNLDVIISVGYRVKSKRGIEFRQWASKILKQYMIDGYAINEKGYGKKAVKLALDFIRTFPCGKAEYCWLSYEPENTVAKELYLSSGFIETSDMDGEEAIAILKF